MKYMKHELHGVSPVTVFTDFHKKQGWKEITPADLMALASSKDETATETPEKVEDMSKKQLETYARGFTDQAGNIIELDRRMNKENMLRDFNEKLGD